MGKVIGVVSLKGGVGKTSSVVSLGHSFASMGKKVLLVDGNLSAPNLGLHFKIVDPATTLHQVLLNQAHPNDAIFEMDDLDVLPASLFNRYELNPLKLRDKLTNLRRRYDVILIDSSPALNDETLAVLNASDEVLVVTTPDHPTLSTTLKAVKYAKRNGTPIVGLILNRVHNKKFELSLDDIEKASEVPVMAVVPYDLNVLKSLSEFVPMVKKHPSSEISKEFKKLAGTLIGEKYAPFSFRNLFGNIFTPKRQEINREIFYESVFSK